MICDIIYFIKWFEFASIHAFRNSHNWFVPVLGSRDSHLPWLSIAGPGMFTRRKTNESLRLRACVVASCCKESKRSCIAAKVAVMAVCWHM